MSAERIVCSWKSGGTVCGAEFMFTDRDHEFYAQKGYVKPKYCRPHREERKRQQQGPFGEALRQSRAASSRRGEPNDRGLLEGGENSLAQSADGKVE